MQAVASLSGVASGCVDPNDLEWGHRLFLAVWERGYAGAVDVVWGCSAAFADNPHAGNSGHFKGSAKPCGNQNNHPKCPGPK